ncbi:MAG: RsmE family RNA methyltransferase [Candidatus Paceibacterota bacterium]
MKLHRFIGEFDLSGENTEITNLENIKQIKGVLRLDVGDFLILCDGKGTEAKVEITEIEKTHITTKIVEKTKKENNSKKVSLYLAILKKENFELAIQKVVEIGVTEIIPIITERTVKTGLNTERLNKIIREASEQSGRTILPILYPTLKFIDAIQDGKKNEGKIFFDFTEDKNNTKNTNSKSISIFIGPEGGFTEKENHIALENGYKIESLGENTLRAETAAIVATYKVVNNL